MRPGAGRRGATAPGEGGDDFAGGADRELYAPNDWTQAHDGATEYPDLLRELRRLWLMEATLPVSPDYRSCSDRFSGDVRWVTIDQRGDDYDREVPPEARFRASLVWE